MWIFERRPIKSLGQVEAEYSWNVEWNVGCAMFVQSPCMLLIYIKDGSQGSG
jgi:hypothetical protein